MRDRSTTTWLSLLLVAGSIAGPSVLASPRKEPAAAQQGVSSASAEVPFSRASIERGKILYQRHCTECHGPDGKAEMDVIADATDLTSPELWYSGTERHEVFASIHDGAGLSMPPYEAEFEDQQIWDLVNFTQSLWPEAKRPELQEESIRPQ